MGVFGLSLPKKVKNIFGAIGHGVNPFDDGQGWTNQAPARPQPRPPLAFNPGAPTPGLVSMRPSTPVKRPILAEGLSYDLPAAPSTASQAISAINRNVIKPTLQQADRAATMVYETPVGRLAGPSRSQMIEKMAKQNPQFANEIRERGYKQLLEDTGIGLNDSKVDIGRKAVSDIGGTAANFIPVGKTVKVVSKGLPAAELFAYANKSGLAGATGTALSSVREGFDAKNMATSALAGYAGGAALPVLGYGARAGAKEVAGATQKAAQVLGEGTKKLIANQGGYVQVGRTPKNIHPEDQGTMSDFIDMQRGVYRPDPRTAQKLSEDAGVIAERYFGHKLPKTDKGLANEFDKRLSKEGFGKKLIDKAKELNDNLGEEGFAKIPGAKETAPEPGKVIVQPAKTGALQNIKKTQSEADQVILDELRNIDKANPRPEGELSRVDEFMYNSNMQRGSNAVANKTLERSDNLEAAFGDLSKDEYKQFSEFANARAELSKAQAREKLTGGKVRVSRAQPELEALVNEGQGKFGQRFEALNQHYKELAKVWHDAEIIDNKTFKSYTDNNDYIRLQRDMEDLVPTAHGAGRGNSYQLGSTQAKQRYKGSERATLDVGDVAAERTQQVYREAAKNRTGTHLVDNLSEHGLARKVSAKASQNKNTVSIFRNGKKEFYEVSPEMKQAMDNINPYHMDIVQRILAAPGRALRAGVTGLNPVFIVANLLKDQVTSAINSKHMLATHNPRTFFEGLFNATTDALGANHNPLYDDFLKHYGDQTSYDLTRNIKDTKAVVNRIRGGKGVGIAQGLAHPVRSLENLASITEKSTRFQNYVGEYRRAIKQGLSKDEASQQAAIAAWQNSVDFSRAGTWGRTINTVIPYWNPGVQGVRQMGRTLADHPVKSVFTGTALVGVPLVASTAWNISSPDTKAIWDNIPEYEKDNNLILIPPGTKQNKDGSYDVIKIPLPPGYKDVFMPLRRAFESYARDKPVEGVKIAQDLVQAISGPVGTQTKGQFAGSFLPQAVKPFVQQNANKDLFTGKEIVPGFMNEALDASGNPVAESKKAYPHSSGGARIIGQATNTSPLRVEKFIKDTAGTVGLNVLNAADNALAKTGKIPNDQIGGLSVPGGFKRRFTSTQGVVNENRSEGAKYFDRVKEAQKGLNSNEKSAFDALHPATKNFLGEQIYEHDAVYDPAARLDIYNRFSKVYEADKKLDKQNRDKGKAGNPMFDLENWQLKKVLEKENLPPGAKDPELTNLYKQDWYADYRTKKTEFFSALKEQSKKEGKQFGSTDNPYPDTPPNVQKAMDTYSSLPKGTGARSSWIKSNPALWNAMQKQFAAVDNWQNVARGKRGLDATEGEEGKAAGYGDASGSKFGFSSKPKQFSAADYLKTYKIGGNIPKGYRGSGKVSVVAAKGRSSGGGKVKVSSRKIRLA